MRRLENVMGQRLLWSYSRDGLNSVFYLLPPANLEQSFVYETHLLQRCYDIYC